MNRLLLNAMVLLLSCIGLLSAAHASVIIEDAFNFRELRSGQALNVDPGDRLIFGGNVRDTDTGARPADATVTARNSSTNQVFALNPSGSLEFFANVPYSTELAEGNWQVTVVSDKGTDFFTLPAFGTGPGTGPVPNVSNLTVSGSGQNRTLNWDLPANLPAANDGNIDRLRIRVQDSNFNTTLDQRLSTGSSLGTTSFTLPDGVIPNNGVFQAQVLVEGFNPFNRSRTYENFSVTDVGAGGAPIDIDPNSLFNYRDLRGPNSVGWTEGDVLTVGLSVDPTIADSAFVSAEQNGQTVLLTQSFDRSTEFAGTLPYDPNLTGPWTATVVSGEFSRELALRPIGSVDTVDFVGNVSMTPNGLTPTINWTLPNDTSDIDVIQIGLFNDATDARIPLGDGGGLFQTIDKSATSFTFPDGVLQEGEKYVARVILNNRDENDLTLSRSIQFINFTPFMDDMGTEIFLPSVDNQGVFNFDIDVAANVPILIDPFVAIGYDYETGAGDPNFQSILVPEVGGDDSFILRFFDGMAEIETVLMANEQFFFPLGGVSAFTILGIDPNVGLDPTDVTAFVSQLTFVADGQFTGSMTPITVFVPDQMALSEPSAALFVLAGAFLILFRQSAVSRRDTKRGMVRHSRP